MFSGSNQTASSGSARTCAMPARMRSTIVSGVPASAVGGHLVGDPQRCAMHECLMQRVLIGEVPVKRGARAAGDPGDVDHRGARNAELGEALTGRVEQVVDGMLAVAMAPPTVIRHIG